MKNKVLLVIICLLFPIAIIFSSNPTNKEKIPTKNEIKQTNIKVKISSTNEVLEISLEDYVIGIIAAEMPASFEIEALKAQAVASRSYALATKKDNQEYDFDDTVANQAFITIDKMKQKWGENFNKYYEKISNAVSETKNMVMKYNEKIITAFYFSMSNGYTENAIVVFNEELPYINSVVSVWEEANNNFLYETTFSKTDFCNKLNINCSSLSIQKITRNDSNRISSITINDKKFSGTELRNLLSIRSTDFEIEQSGEKVIVITKGYGHGVGMSQYGANGMAKDGYSYEEILNYYYQDIKIEEI